MQRITLMEAYAVESLRSNGYSNEEIVEKVRSNNTEAFNTVNKNMDYSTLVELEASDFLENILEEGYQVKFLTINGLRNLLEMKYGKEDGVDYLLDNFVVTGLQLEEEEQKDLQNLLSPNWKMSVEENGITISPAHDSEV